MAIRIYTGISRSMFEGLADIRYGGQPAQLVDRHGNSLLGAVSQPPTLPGTIADQELTIGDDPVVIDLSTVISGALTYETSALPANVARSGSLLTITPTTALAQTPIIARGRNSGGVSPDLTFNITVAIAAPELTPNPTITPATGAVGTQFTIIPGVYSGTGPLTRAGTLRQAGVVVAMRSNGASFTFTSTAEGPLEWDETVENAAGSAGASASAVITALQIVPELNGGSLTVQDDDVLLTPPTATGSPTPGVVLTTLTLNGADIRGQVIGGIIPDGAVPGGVDKVYAALWTATSSAGSDTATASLTIEGIAQPEAIVNPDQTITFQNVTTNTPPFSWSQPAESTFPGSYTVNPADFIAGPVVLVPPTVSRANGIVTLSPEYAVRLLSSGTVTRAVEWLADGEIIPGEALDILDEGTPGIAGAVIAARVLLTDDNGTRTTLSSNSVTLPAVDPEPEPGMSITMTTDGFIIENPVVLSALTITMTSDGFTATPTGGI